MTAFSLRKISLKYKIAAALLVMVMALLAAWAFIIEPDRLLIRESAITLQDWPADFDGYRIAIITDLHVGARFMTLDKLREVVRRTNALQPDLVVLLGDYVVNNHGNGTVRVEPQVFVPPLGELRAKDGVYGVLGNHDWWYDGFKVSRAFEQGGIRMLDNDALQIRRGRSVFWLAGLGDCWTLNHQIQRTLAKITDDAPVMAITHAPDLFPELPARVSLLLAGHTHGGQVNLPLLGRLVVPSQFGSRYAIGHIEEKGRHLFVSPGIGTSIMPVRFRVPPEISVVTLRRAQPPPTK